jgi:hypothetical protein
MRSSMATSVVGRRQRACRHGMLAPGRIQHDRRPRDPRARDDGPARPAKRSDRRGHAGARLEDRPQRAGGAGAFRRARTLSRLARWPPDSRERRHRRLPARGRDAHRARGLPAGRRGRSPRSDRAGPRARRLHDAAEGPLRAALLVDPARRRRRRRVRRAGRRRRARDALAAARRDRSAAAGPRRGDSSRPTCSPRSTSSATRCRISARRSARGTSSSRAPMRPRFRPSSAGRGPARSSDRSASSRSRAGPESERFVCLGLDASSMGSKASRRPAPQRFSVEETARPRHPGCIDAAAIRSRPATEERAP